MGLKIDTAKVKKNTILDIDGNLMKVLDTSFMQMQQRQGSYTYKVQNIVTGNVQTVTFKSGTAIDLADVSKMSAVFLYNAGDIYSFMENDTGEMHELDASIVGNIAPYLKENLDVFLEKHGDNVLNIILPATVQYIIKETVPGVRGDRAQAGKKPATLETGMEVQVPLHKSEGDTVTINTETGDIA
jgi:elongation factor P